MPRYDCRALVYESDLYEGIPANLVFHIPVNARDTEEAVRKAKREIHRFYRDTFNVEYEIAKIECKVIE